MEEAIIQMKKRNAELVKENRDAVDSPGSPKFVPPTEQILQLREELSKKEIEHSERIVEMVCASYYSIYPTFHSPIKIRLTHATNIFTKKKKERIKISILTKY